jgi:hypothetical protein
MRDGPRGEETTKHTKHTKGNDPLESTTISIDIENPWLGTPSGQRFFPFTPWKSAIDIEDIAHGLAGKYRYAGLSNRWYTVAQHAIEVSRRFPSRTNALWGLLHDAAETWLTDIPAPIKGYLFFAIPVAEDSVRVASYRALEEEILSAVAETFGLPWPVPDSIHTADLRERARERRDLFDESQPGWKPMSEPYPEPLVPVSPDAAKKMFLARFKELTA